MKAKKLILTLALACSCMTTLPMASTLAYADTADVLIASDSDETTDSVAYTTQTIDKTKTFKGPKATVTDTQKYTRIVLEGDTDAIEKINSKLTKLCNKQVKKMSHKYAKSAAKEETFDIEYVNTYDSKVTYNANGVISIAIAYNWFQGGTYDYGYSCYTFDLSTGKLLKLTDVCNGTNAELTKKLQNRLVKKYGKDAFFEDGLEGISAEKCDFYINKKGKAVVVFDKYEISYGAAGMFEIKLPTQL